VLCPRLGVAVIVDAAPPALVPHQACGPTEAGQVSDLDWHPIVGLGALTTAATANEVRVGLDVDDDLFGGLGHLEDPEAVESQQRVCQPTTVDHRQGSPRRRSR